MPNQGTGEGSQQTSRSSFRRRKFLKAAGVAGATGLAGCSGGGLGGGGTNEIYLGIQVPLSGPYGSSGKAVANAMKLAAKDAEKDGEFKKVTTKVKDTKTDPGTGRKKAREHINNGADLLAGNISSATALAIGELATQNDMVYNCVAGSTAVTGEKCKPATFAWSDSGVMQLGGSLGYVAENVDTGGNEVYMISADYEWGQSLVSWINNNMADKLGLKILGNKFMPFGASDYSGPLSTVKDKDPDIVMFNLAGTDKVTTIKQAAQYGVLDDYTCVWAASNIGDAAAIPQDLLSHPNHYTSIAWYWDHDYSDATNSFVKRFKEEYPDSLRDAYTGSFYAGVRNTLSTIAETGSTKLSDLRPKLEDSKITPQVWGVGEKMRGCDHRATIATTTVTGKDPSKVSGQDYYKVLDVPSQEKIMNRMRTCEQTGCSFK